MKLPRAHHLTTTELAAQLLLVQADFGFFNRDHPETRRRLRVLHCHPAGWQFTGLTHPADVRYWTELLDKEARYPQIFAADIRGGLDEVMHHATRFPIPEVIFAAANGKYATDLSHAIAKEARSVGFNLLFYPVLSYKTAAHAETIEHITNTIQQYGIVAFVKCPAGLLHNLNMSTFPSGFLNPDGMAAATTAETAIMQVADLKIDSSNAEANGKKIIQLLDGGASMLRVDFEAFDEALKICAEAVTGSSAAISTARKAVERIFRLKKWLHKRKPGQIHPRRIYRIIGHPGHLALATKIANAGKRDEK